eukprot:SAG31_NODE_4341_length_3339_cov_1.487346_1_plen_214_part_00
MESSQVHVSSRFHFSSTACLQCMHVYICLLPCTRRPDMVLRQLVGPTSFKKIKHAVLAAVLCIIMVAMLPLIFSDFMTRVLEKGPMEIFTTCADGMVKAGDLYESQCVQSAYQAEHGLPLRKSCCPGPLFDSMGLIPRECLCDQSDDDAKDFAPEFSSASDSEKSTVCSRTVWRAPFKWCAVCTSRIQTFHTICFVKLLLSFVGTRTSCFQHQ